MAEQTTTDATADADAASADAAADAAAAADDTTDDDTGDASWPAEARKAMRAANREAAKRRKETDDLRKQLADRDQAAETETDKLVREARADERAKAEQEFAAERLANRLRAKAAGKLADPEDAVLHISDLEPDATDAELVTALDALLEAKPYLAAGTNGSTTAQPSQGRRQPAAAASAPSDDWLRKAARGK